MHNTLQNVLESFYFKQIKTTYFADDQGEESDGSITTVATTASRLAQRARAEVGAEKALEPEIRQEPSSQKQTETRKKGEKEKGKSNDQIDKN